MPPDHYMLEHDRCPVRQIERHLRIYLRHEPSRRKRDNLAQCAVIAAEATACDMFLLVLPLPNLRCNRAKDRHWSLLTPRCRPSDRHRM